jgi:glutathione-specific gamma-glutamylcyclotransferase
VESGTLTFVASRAHDRYIADRSPERVAELILSGRGSLGSARTYFDSTREALARLGISDPNIERVRRAVLAAERAVAG